MNNECASVEREKIYKEREKERENNNTTHKGTKICMIGTLSAVHPF